MFLQVQNFKSQVNSLSDVQAAFVERMIYWYLPGGHNPKQRETDKQIRVPTYYDPATGVAHRADTDKPTKLRVYKHGHFWWAEPRKKIAEYLSKELDRDISPRQLAYEVEQLVQAGIIVKENFKFDGLKTLHYRFSFTWVKKLWGYIPEWLYNPSVFASYLVKKFRSKYAYYLPTSHQMKVIKEEAKAVENDENVTCINPLKYRRNFCKTGFTKFVKPSIYKEDIDSKESICKTTNSETIEINSIVPQGGSNEPLITRRSTVRSDQEEFGNLKIENCNNFEKEPPNPQTENLKKFLREKGRLMKKRATELVAERRSSRMSMEEIKSRCFKPKAKDSDTDFKKFVRAWVSHYEGAGFHAGVFTAREKGQTKHLLNQAGVHPRGVEMITSALRNWQETIDNMEQFQWLPKYPPNPTIGFLLKYVVAIINTRIYIEQEGAQPNKESKTDATDDSHYTVTTPTTTVIVAESKSRPKTAKRKPRKDIDFSDPLGFKKTWMK